ncbi:MAG: glycosyltransferase family 4 protein [Streptosporangiaceae bacterium]|jgi:UDP-glucose:(glucosyl)LPS alpha-1,2-glucosyltransferase
MGGIAWSPGSNRASGGTQLMGRWLEERLPAELLDHFQIHMSQREPEEPGKIQILWCHLHHLAVESTDLANGGWRRFHRIVFVSNWQAQGFINHFGIPWSRCVVMHNAIEPLTVGDDRFEPIPADRPIRLVYTSVPERGLAILYHAFKKIAEERDDVELEVFSSFRLYGWEDGVYQQLFDALQQVPRVTYHGAVSNEQTRKALVNSHIHAFPSIKMETGCLALIEAMSAGLACVHSNFGGLFETAAGLTLMYQYQEDPTGHTVVFYDMLKKAINAVRAGDPRLRSRLAAQKSYADAHYNWQLRASQWESFLRGLIRGR